MGLSILAAKFLALTYLSTGVAAMRGKINFARMVEEFEKSSALTFLAGFWTLLLGVLLVQYHNHWAQDWTVLITLIGWIALLKGIMLIAFPGAISLFRGWYRHTPVWGLFMIILGLVFGYFGFLAG